MDSAGSTHARTCSDNRHRHGSASALRDRVRRRRSRPRAAASDRPIGNAVTHWNAVATDAFTPSQGTNPMAQSRTLAILHAAMHDALNAIDRRFEAYTPGLDRHQGRPAKRQSPQPPAMSW